MGILNDMLQRLTDNYNKDPNSNTGKLLNLAAKELEAIRAATTLTKAFRDIDQATGATLDRIGRNVLEDRGDKNDVDYRKFIKIKIVANLSGGEIETINEVLSVLMGDAYLGLRETWNLVSYGNEPAALAIRYDDEILYEDIDKEYEDLENDPWFLNGAFLLDGTRSLDGGLTYDPQETFSARIQTVQRIQEASRRIVAGGVRVYFEIPKEVVSQVEIQQSVQAVISTQAASLIGVENDVSLPVHHQVSQDQINRLDGVHLLNGQVNLDAQREFVVHNVSISEVSA